MSAKRSVNARKSVPSVSAAPEVTKTPKRDECAFYLALPKKQTARQTNSSGMTKNPFAPAVPSTRKTAKR